MEKKLIRAYQDIEVLQIAFKFAMQISRESKSFPMEAHYPLTDRVCHPSRSVCANLAEACLRPRGAE